MAEAPARVRRIARPKMRDTRLIVGVALIISSILVGGFLFRSVTQTTEVVMTTSDIAQGGALDRSDLVVVDVNVGDARRAYVTSLDQIPAGALASRPLVSGELVPLASVGQAEESSVRPVAIPVADQISVGLEQGDIVEIWRTDAEDPSATSTIVNRAIVRSFDQGGGLAMHGQVVEVLVPAEAVPVILRAKAAGDPLAVIEVPGQFEVFE